MSSDPFKPSKEYHEEQCKQAGCKHPVVYPWGQFGWCQLCREVASKEKDEKNGMIQEKLYRLIHYTRLFPSFEAISTEWGDHYPDLKLGSLAIHIEGPKEFPDIDGKETICQAVKVASSIGIGWVYLSAYEKINYD